MGWPILFLKDRWKRYNETSEVNGAIIHLTAQVRFLGDLSLIPHFISQPMPNASPVQADAPCTEFPDGTSASALHVHTPHPERVCVSALGPEPSVLTSSLFDRATVFLSKWASCGRHPPPSVCGPAVSHRTNGKTQRRSCAPAPAIS